MVQEKVVDAHNTGTSAGTSTVATVQEVAGRSLDVMTELRARLNVTQALDGDTPTLDVYLQRKVGAGDDWEDFYHFPQVTTSTVDKVVTLPLPLAQDVDGSLGSMSRDQETESLAADTALAGHWSGPVRIREVLATGGSISQAAIYDIEMVGR